MKNLYLIPTPISEDLSCIPPHTIKIISRSHHFICERIRTSRRFIKSIIPNFEIDNSNFIELDKRDEIHNNVDIMELLKKGQDISFMSEAGSPCIADPGSSLVNLASEHGYTIHPLSGPSSIMLALMASGLNGQSFTFRGYLPVKRDQLIKELRSIERTILQNEFTQIFIETPYRNLNMFDTILGSVNDGLKLNISLGIYTDQEYLTTQAISKWKKEGEIRKRLESKIPCIFMLGK